MRALEAGCVLGLWALLAIQVEAGCEEGTKLADGSWNPACWTGYQPGGEKRGYDCWGLPASYGIPTEWRGFCPMEQRGGEVPEFGKDANTIFIGGLKFHNLTHPTSLAFHPKFPGQLWVTNFDTNSATIFFNPGGSPENPAVHQRVEWRQDNEACHFMSHPTQISFGGSTKGSKPHPCSARTADGSRPAWMHPGGDCNVYSVNQTNSWGADFPDSATDGLLDDAGTFMVSLDDDQSYDMYDPKAENSVGADESPYHGVVPKKFAGPALFPADLKLFAIKNNDVFTSHAAMFPEASHISMVHEQPFSMGSAWSGEGAKYYTWDAGSDSVHGSISEVDFVYDHGFGGVTHPEINIRRFHGLTIGYKMMVPGHMAMCNSLATKKSQCGNWLYVADPGNGRVVRLDVTSGREDGPVKSWAQWREGYYNYTRIAGAKWDVVHDCPDKVPSGLVISADGKRLFVGYRNTGEIVALEIGESPKFRELGRFRTPSTALGGLAIDPVGRIFYTDIGKNQVRMVNALCTVPDGVEHGCDLHTHPFKPEQKNATDFQPPMDPAHPDETLYNAKHKKTFHFYGCVRQYFDSCLVHSGEEHQSDGWERDGMLSYRDGPSRAPINPCPQLGLGPYNSGGPDGNGEPLIVKKDGSWTNTPGPDGDLMHKWWKPETYAIVENPFSNKAKCTCVDPRIATTTSMYATNGKVQSDGPRASSNNLFLVVAVAVATVAMVGGAVLLVKRVIRPSHDYTQAAQTNDSTMAATPTSL